MRLLLSLVSVALLLFVSVRAIGVEVKTKYGLVKGYTTAAHAVWKGIPYAAPPVGALRWQLPKDPQAWTGVKNTVAASASCAQPGVEDISEDCLYLNIFSPLNATANESLPVYIFIHGGSFWGGSGGGVDGEYLSGNDIIFVSINYRLGAFGYLALPELMEASHVNTTGFYGMQDQRLAFSWVKENIRAFGGDPNRVTIAGQSAGAISVCIHVAAPRSANLFQRAVMESGTCVINTPQSAFSQSGNVKKALNCSGAAAEVLKCLYSKNMTEIVKATGGPIWPIPNPYEFDVQPIDMLRTGKFNRVELIAGVNHDEQSFEACPWYGNINATEYPTTLNKVFGSHYGPLVEKQYPISDFTPPVAGIVQSWSDSRFKCPTLEALEAISSHQTQPVYMYSFNHVPSWQTNKCLNVTHSTELAFLYPGHPDFVSGTPEEKQLSATMHDYWTSFIQTGIPKSKTSDVAWTRLENTTQAYLVLDVPKVYVQEKFEESNCNFWANYIP